MTGAFIGADTPELHGTSPSPAAMGALVAQAQVAPLAAAQVGQVVGQAHGSVAGISALVGLAAAEAHASSLETNRRAMAGGLWAEIHIPITKIPWLFLPVPNEGTVTEKFEWMTDVLPNYDGTEQRISTRNRPRRTLSLSFQSLTEDERRSIEAFMFQAATIDMFIPAWPYQSYVKCKSVAGSNIIYFNVDRGDLRLGETVMVWPKNGSPTLYTVQKVFSDSIRIGRPLEADCPEGSILIPAQRGRPVDNLSIGMNAIMGSGSFDGLSLEFRDQICYPGREYAFETMDSFPIVDRRASADGQASNSFNGGVEVIDNDTGVPAYFTSWNQPYVGGQRNFLVNRLFSPSEMDYWHSFLDWCRGQQRAFLMPTYREDLVAIDGTLSADGVTVAGNEYFNLYSGSNTYARLQIETSVGTFFVKVASLTNDGESTTLAFDTPIGVSLDGATVNRISFLMLYRLGNDTVTLTHDSGFTVISFTVKAAVA